MTYEIKPLSVFYMRNHGAELLEEHYQELTLFKDVVKLDVLWTRYKELEERGNLMAIGLWEDGVLIGYSAFIIIPHIHYKNVIVGQNDVLFLTKSKRKGRAGLRLIQESEKFLEKRGVTKVIWHCKYGTSLGPILDNMGYVDEEFVVSKILGK